MSNRPGEGSAFPPTPEPTEDWNSIVEARRICRETGSDDVWTIECALRQAYAAGTAARRDTPSPIPESTR